MIKSVEQKVLKDIIRGYTIDKLYLIDEVVNSCDSEKQDDSEFLNLQSVVETPKGSFEYKKQDHPIGDI